MTITYDVRALLCPSLDVPASKTGWHQLGNFW
jgi:hypothetical protein